MLLIIEALLIVAALGQDRRAAVEETIYPLDMADNSVDDQYFGCTKEMEKLVEEEYLEKEKFSDFENSWRVSQTQTPTTDILSPNQMTAIYAYTLNDIYKEFNEAVRTERKKYKDKTFEMVFTSLSVNKSTTDSENYTVYRGTGRKFKGKKGMTFRFGTFASFSRLSNVARRFANEGRGTCFELKDYKGARVAKYSKYRVEEEVLIPPYEKFKVTDVMTRKKDQNLWCETVFELKSAGEKSDLNCALFKKSFLSKLGCCGKH